MPKLAFAIIIALLLWIAPATLAQQSCPEMASCAEGVGVAEFSADEVVRHPLVTQIVRAYQAPARPLTTDSTEE